MLFTDDQIIEELSAYISAELFRGESELEIGPELQLIESGVIDSIALFKLIGFIEEKFEVKLAPDELVMENFDSLKKVLALIKTKLS